jgi:hypothetical protein
MLVPSEPSVPSSTPVKNAVTTNMFGSNRVPSLRNCCIFCSERYLVVLFRPIVVEFRCVFVFCKKGTSSNTKYDTHTYLSTPVHEFNGLMLIANRLKLHTSLFTSTMVHTSKGIASICSSSLLGNLHRSLLCSMRQKQKLPSIHSRMVRVRSVGSAASYTCRTARYRIICT